MARLLIVISVLMVIVKGSFLNDVQQSDIFDAEESVHQEGYLPVEDALEHQSHHHGDIASHHDGSHHHLEQNHHDHGSHHHQAEPHHLPHHHLETPHFQHHHLETPDLQHHHLDSAHLPHHHLEVPHHSIHHVSPLHHYQHHHQHHPRNCHAIHCPRTHSPTYATDGHSCFRLDNVCELAVINCLRRNELHAVLHHISQHECHHLPGGYKKL
ncbi:hypothetical protein KR067_011279 [Drosophila pandora]|nr:hypothetical protein KR067_011279 [Drosophila pandora]